MRYQLFVLLFVVLLVSADACTLGIVGGWSPIKDIHDPQIIGMANFAVTEYDKRTGLKLKLKNIVKGEVQIISGTNYHLTLSAGDSSGYNVYETVVYESLQHSKNLTSFVPSNCFVPSNIDSMLYN
ncbi:unnamed protein product [Lathyrus sativus]|nr:unnamed protein product [Lathyrus sativus]